MDKPEANSVYGGREKMMEYFDEATREILGAVGKAASLTGHPGIKGEAGELAVKQALSTLLPPRYGIGSGHISTFNKISKQTDLVIFDYLDCYKVPINENDHVFSLEGVYAGGEVKSNPSRSSLKSILREALENIGELKELSMPSFSSWAGFFALPRSLDWIGNIDVKKIEDNYLLGIRPGTQMKQSLGVVFIIGASEKSDTIHQQFASLVIEENLKPADIVCVIDEENYCLFGKSDRLVNNKPEEALWIEDCSSPGDTLAKFFYWLNHLMLFEQKVAWPITLNDQGVGFWPSVYAPIIGHIKATGSSTMYSFPWKEETRKFRFLNEELNLPEVELDEEEGVDE